MVYHPPVQPSEVLEYEKISRHVTNRPPRGVPMRLCYSDDSAYASISSPEEVASPSTSDSEHSSNPMLMAAELFGTNDEFGLKDKDECMPKDKCVPKEYVLNDKFVISDKFVLNDEMTTLTRGTASKRERKCLDVSVEDFSWKRRRMNTGGNHSQVSQLPDMLQPAQTPYGSFSINPHLQTLSTHAQKRFDASESERDMDQSSDAGDSDSCGDNDGSNNNHSNDNVKDDDCDDYDDYDDDDGDSVDEVEPQYRSNLPYTLSFAQHAIYGSGSRNRNTEGSNATPSVRSVSFGSSASDLQPGVTIESPGDGGNNDVATGSRRRSLGSDFKPQDLMCWHAANGYRCPGNKTGMSSEVRRLLNDHSCSTKSVNTHKLPPSCQRCRRLFEDESSLEQHTDKLRSNTLCDILSSEDLEHVNKEANRKGISLDREKQIREALKTFKKDKRPPPGCTPTTYKNWIASNKPIYIGQSNITEQGAESELGQWLTVWYLLFPDEELPDHPFGGAGGWKQSQQIADLSIIAIREDMTNRLLPELNQEHLELIRRRIIRATKIQCREALEKRNATPKARNQRQRKVPLTPNPSLSSPSTMTTPGLSRLEFTTPNYTLPATHKGGAIDLQIPPTQPLRTSVATVTPMPFPSPNQSQDSEKSLEEAPTCISRPQVQTPSFENEMGSYDSQAHPTVPDQDISSVWYDDSYPVQGNMPNTQGSFNELLHSILSQDNHSSN